MKRTQHSFTDFKALEKEGLTVIYKESESELIEDGWSFWGKQKTPHKDVFVYRKIVTFEEAEQYELENELLN